jgi:hypothetical protein
MKITKRQLKRIIKEEKAKLVREARYQDAPQKDNYEDPAGGMLPGQDELYYRALDDLQDELKNSIANALEKGLIIDDLEDAWEEAKLYIKDTQ